MIFFFLQCSNYRNNKRYEPIVTFKNCSVFIHYWSIMLNLKEYPIFICNARIFNTLKIVVLNLAEEFFTQYT